LKIVVLRWGHRPRDMRVTSHVALTARAFGASGLVLTDAEDRTVATTTRRVVERWGGSFNLDMGIAWQRFVKSWRQKGGATVHLTVYGENIESSDVMERIRSAGKDILVLIGSQKVPAKFYSEDISDFNVAIGNQPHSEVAALAVFLDRLFEGKELSRQFQDAKVRVIPSTRRKQIIST
jgi:tRNA (cytidine56-2'-O)-methyltransferase